MIISGISRFYQRFYHGSGLGHKCSGCSGDVAGTQRTRRRTGCSSGGAGLAGIVGSTWQEPSERHAPRPRDEPHIITHYIFGVSDCQGHMGGLEAMFRNSQQAKFGGAGSMLASERCRQAFEPGCVASIGVDGVWAGASVGWPASWKSQHMHRPRRANAVVGGPAIALWNVCEYAPSFPRCGVCDDLPQWTRSCSTLDSSGWVAGLGSAPK